MLGRASPTLQPNRERPSGSVTPPEGQTNHLPRKTQISGLAHTLGHHGIGDLEEAGDVGTKHEVALVAVLARSGGGGAVDGVHDPLELLVHLVEGPGEVLVVLAHLEARDSDAAGVVYQMTFAEMLEQIRVQYACAYLTGSDVKITEISERCGFESLSTFHRVFRKHCFVSPGAYRKNQI